MDTEAILDTFTFEQKVEEAAKNPDKTFNEFEELKNNRDYCKKQVKEQLGKLKKYFEEDKDDEFNICEYSNAMDLLNHEAHWYVLYRYKVKAKEPIVEAVREKLSQESNTN